MTPEVIRAIERQAEHDNRVHSLLKDGRLACLATIASSSSTPLLPALRCVLGGPFDMDHKIITTNDSSCCDSTSGTIPFFT